MVPEGASSCTRFFVIARYWPDDEGAFTPELPTVGPCRAGDDGPQCRLGVHHWRDRKTGPCFRLAVVRCRAHHRAFTLYPPGHVPYGRRAIAPVSSDDRRVCDEDGAPAWSSTMFSAALDAQDGAAWSRDDGSDDYTGGGSDRWWSTQCRHLARLMRLVGVHPNDPELRRARLSHVLIVPLLLLLEQARLLGRGAGYRARGGAICAVLSTLPASGRVADQLAAAGWVAGLWGQPHRWDHANGALRPLYPQYGTRGPPAP